MKRRIFNLVLVLVLTLSLFSTVSAQGYEAKYNSGAKPYVVIMIDDPVVQYEGDIGKLKATKPDKGGKINPNSAHVKKYVDYLENSHDKALKSVGASPRDKIYSYSYAVNGFAAVLFPSEAEELAKVPGVASVKEDVMRYKTTDSTADFLGLTGPAGAYAKGYDGEGVVVGVIDSGIWPEHPSFADDGSFAPLPEYAGVACEFGNTAHNPDDAPFTCNNKLLGARQMLDTYRLLIGADPDEFDSARDDDGHGTHTASTAAGNAGVEASIYGIPRGTVSGIAPRARVIAYKGLGNLGGFGSDLAAAIDQAVADGVDVINYSVGGGPSLTGADDIAYLFAADAGVFVATSAGNSGPGDYTMGGPASVPWITSVGASTQTRFFQATAVLGDGSEYTGASVTPGTGVLPLVDAEFAGGDLCIPGTLDPGVVAGNIVLCRRGAIARADKSLAVFQAGGAGMIMYNNSDDDNLFTDTHWVPSVHIDNTPGLAIKAYIASAAEPTAQIIGEQISEWDAAPSMTIFSSRGPNPVAEDIIKPDITAPGIQILAGNSPFPDPGAFPGELYQAIAGTSMSSPVVAGVFALIKQAHPDWSPAMAKSAIMTTAYQDVRDNDRVSQADPFDMGAGHIDPGNKANKGSIFEPGLAYDAGFLDYLGFLCSADPSVFADPASTCGFLESIGVPTDPSDLNLPSIGIAEVPGSQTIQRTVTSVAKENGWRTYNVSVDAPEGYDVSVSPSQLRLKSGMSATYEVTITNVSAPIGEWRFGSLTWSDKTGHYDVYSPIAVRGSLFDAPSAVEGSGASGSASFGVKFGYTGAYAAAPHGLVAPILSSGAIGQDPDQTYPSGDDSPVGVQEWDFPINDAAFVRFELVIPGDDDIDLFLENSAGDIIASSTNGGTDELVELFLPANDTYTMVVHGWSVPNAPLPYTMSTWIVPLASGGSLSVDSAPASAVAGTIGTVDISWSGLAAGHYLGAVSHTGDSGLMGLTLVEVDSNTLAAYSYPSFEMYLYLPMTTR
jgi:subtilisin family serine protease